MIKSKHHVDAEEIAALSARLEVFRCKEFKPYEYIKNRNEHRALNIRGGNGLVSVGGSLTFFIRDELKAAKFDFDRTDGVARWMKDFDDLREEVEACEYIESLRAVAKKRRASAKKRRAA